MAEKQDCVAYINIGGVDYLAREHRYSATVLRLSDTASVTIPAPDGKVRGADGSQTPIKNVATMGQAVEFALADPNVKGGARIKKFSGTVTGRQMQGGRDGTTLAVTVADQGWKLSSCGPVFQNLRGLTWRKFFSKLCGIEVDATGAVTADRYGWGFQGIRAGNAFNRAVRLGRQVAQSDFSQEVSPSIMEPRFQVEVGQTLDALAIQYAKIDGFLVNVSTDGWIQIFRPNYTQQPLYSFYRSASESGRKRNNVMNPAVEESADGLYTHVECWSSVIDTTDNDPTNPNAGRYHGEYDNTGTLPFARRYTFTDTEQMGQSRVDQRAKWQFQRFLFDSWTYSFETVGHSQGGNPFVEDTMASLTDAVYGYEGLFYVAAVEPSRKLARPGFDPSAGTRTKITLKRANLLGA